MNIAIDEDDGIAIVVSSSVKENEILKTLVLTALGSKQIAPSKSNDLQHFTVLYEVNEILLRAYDGGFDTSKISISTIEW